jgi:hypothetical protein
MASMDLAEMIIYNSALTESQLRAVEMYLSAKWGVYS